VVLGIDPARAGTTFDAITSAGRRGVSVEFSISGVRSPASADEDMLVLVISDDGRGPAPRGRFPGPRAVPARLRRGARMTVRIVIADDQELDRVQAVIIAYETGLAGSRRE
jgi:hypothetical protein